MVQFYTTGAKHNFSVGAGLISLLLSPISLSSSEIDTERDRIKAEIRENDERGSLANFTSSIVHDKTTLSRPITGSLGSVSRITRKRLEQYRKDVFTAENVFLYVTGSFTDGDLDTLSEVVEKFVPCMGAIHSNVAPVSSNFFKREPVLHIKNADYTMLRFTFDMDMSRISVAESDLLYDLLLTGYNSRFFVEMSEKRGIFYDLSGSTERYKNIGNISFYFEVKSSAVTEAVRSTFEILKDFLKSPPAEAECMKAGYVDNAYMLYDDMRELNFTFAYDNHILNAGYGSIDERMEAYSSITPQRILDVAGEIFKPSNLTLTVKGKKSKINIESINNLLSEF